MHTSSSNLDYVIDLLADEMTYRGDRSDVIFLLGAGCSCQYGLPGFYELLKNVYTDFTGSEPDSGGVLELRSKLDERWKGKKTEVIQRILCKYLDKVDGASCLGYRRLAKLIKKHRVYTVVNLNFDTLLEDALTAEGVDYTVSRTFTTPVPEDGFVIYKPHGSIQGAHRPVLNITSTEGFDTIEKDPAHSLLGQRPVVVLGYSGGDTKIGEALLPEGEDKPNLFVASIEWPQSHLLRAISARVQEINLLTVGEDAAFENFMEDLEDAVEAKLHELKNPFAPLRNGEKRFSRSESRMNLMTRSEREALDRCLEGAAQLRLSINVADASRISIEKHGNQVFDLCMSIARNSRVYLNSIEKYLLHCTAYLHDLGYFRGYARDRTDDYSGGWKLLREHGKLTADILRENFDSCLKGIIPQSYGFADDSEDAELFRRALCQLCRGHSGLPDRDLEEGLGEDLNFNVCFINFTVRVKLLVRLFAVAEELAEAHPFLPSPDSIETHAEDGHGPIVDPVLDLYLRGKGKRVSYTTERSRIVARSDQGQTAIVQWFLGLVAYHVNKFDEIARTAEEPPGSRMRLMIADSATMQERPYPISDYDSLLDLLRAALKEALEAEIQHCLELDSRSSHARNVIRRSEAHQPGTRAAIIDLVAMYTLPMEQGGKESEPRVRLQEPVVASALKNVTPPSAGLGQYLYTYLAIGRDSEADASFMGKVLADTFRELHAAWRFFARNCHDGIEVLHVTQICLSLGSSRYRSEISDALKRLLAPKRGLVFSDESKAYGHNECTLCTARIINILSHSRILFSGHEEIVRELNPVMRKLLYFFADREQDDPAWQGLGTDKERLIQSADYLAWAARAVAFFLDVDREIEEKEGAAWMSKNIHPEKSIEKLLEERCAALLGIAESSFLNPRAEEPFSAMVGRVATAYLHIDRLVRGRSVGSFEREVASRDFASLIVRAADDVGGKTREKLSQISRFNLWPAELLRDKLRHENKLADHGVPGAQEEQEDKILDLYRNCLYSSIWVKEGPYTGSWGYDIQNTQNIVTSVVEFWTYALGNTPRFEAAFERNRAKFPMRSNS